MHGPLFAELEHALLMGDADADNLDARWDRFEQLLAAVSSLHAFRAKRTGFAGRVGEPLRKSAVAKAFCWKADVFLPTAEQKTDEGTQFR